MANTKILYQIRFLVFVVVVSFFSTLHNLKLYELTNSADSRSEGEKATRRSSFHQGEQRDVNPLAERLQKERNRTRNETLLQFEHRGTCGLGHNLLRFSNSYHLAKSLNVSRMILSINPFCGGDIFSIPNMLFGSGPILVGVPSLIGPTENLTKATLPGTWTIPNMTASKGSVSFNNEVPGYTGIRYSKIRGNEYHETHFYGKKDSDFEFFHQLLTLFESQHKTRIQEIVQHFHNSTVLGLHVRAGNGEFDRSHRQTKNITQWVHHTLASIEELVQRIPNRTHAPIVLFLATDTESVLHQMQIRSKESKIPIKVVSAASFFLPEGEGVSFEGKQLNSSETCLETWRDAFLDMYLLSQCHTVIAGQYSSFTLSAPFSVVMQNIARDRGADIGSQPPRYFCQVGEVGDRMDCFDNFHDWYRLLPVLSVGNMNSPPQKSTMKPFLPMQQSKIDWHDFFQGNDHHQEATVAS